MTLSLALLSSFMYMSLLLVVTQRPCFPISLASVPLFEAVVAPPDLNECKPYDEMSCSGLSPGFRYVKKLSLIVEYVNGCFPSALCPNLVLANLQKIKLSGSVNSFVSSRYSCVNATGHVCSLDFVM